MSNQLPAARKPARLVHTATDVDTPEKVARALTRIQHNLTAALAAVRSSSQQAASANAPVFSGAETHSGSVSFTGSVTFNVVPIGAVLPPGVIVPFASTGTTPSGWLICDGSAVSRTTYAALFGVLSTTYGAGDGNTTFNLPDLRDDFVRGLDNMGGPAGARGLALAAAQGTEQLDAFQGHWHDAYYGSAAGVGEINGSGTGPFVQMTAGTIKAPSTDGVNGTPRTAVETRPRNQAVKFIIKT